MKKLKKRIIILAGSLVVFIGIVLAVALNSGFQTKIVLGILQKTDPQAKLTSVSFGFGRGEVHGLELTAGGALIKLDTAKLQYSLTNLIFGATKVIDSAEATGLVVDLSVPHPSNAAPAANPAAAAGGKKSPPAILIKKADVSAMVLLADKRTIDLSLSAQNVGAGSQGKASGNVSYHDQSPDAKVSEMHANTQITIALSDAMLPQDVDCTVDLTADLPGQTQPSQLSAHLLLKPTTAQSGQIALTLAPPTGAALIDFKGSYTTDGSATGDFTTNLTRAQIEPFALGFKLPDFALQGQGQLAGDATQRSGSVKASLTGNLGHLEVLRPELAGVGGLKVDATLDVSATQPNAAEKTYSIVAKALTANLTPQGGQTAVTVELLKPLTVTYGAQGVKLPAGAGADVARLTLNQMPVAWLTAVLPKEYAVTGQGLNGQVTLSAQDDDALTANTTQPLAFLNFEVKKAGQIMLAGAQVNVDGSAQYLNKSLQAQVRLLGFAATTVAANNVTLKSVALNTSIVRGGFSGNISVVPGLSFPQILANGRSSLILDIDQLDQKALGNTLPALAPAGLLTLTTNLDVATAVSITDAKDLSLNVNSLQVTLTKGTGNTQATFLTLTGLQKFSLPLGADAKLQPVSGNLASLEVNSFPLSVAQTFLPPRFKFSGNPLTGKILLIGAAGTEPAIALQTTQPFTIQNARFSQDNIDKLANVTLSLSPEGTWKSGEVTGSAHLQATSTAGILLDATLGAAQSKDTLTANVTANGQLAAIAAQPVGADWRAYLPATKPQFTVSANVSRTPQALTIQSAEAAVAPTGGAALADIKLSQPIALQTDPADAKKFLWPKANGDVLSIKMSSLPAGVLALALPGYRLQGREISADLLLHGAGDGNYSLIANAPITAAGLSFARLADNAPPTEWVRDLTFTLKPSATFNNEGVSVGNVQDLRLASGNTPLVSGNVDFTFAPAQTWPQQAKISAQADLALLLNQPILAKFNNLTSGKLQMDGTLSPDGSVSLTASVTDWTVRDSQTQLPQMVFQNATGKINHTTGEMQINLPVKGQSKEGPTDCLLAADYGPSGTSHKFSLSLTGNNLVIDDLMAVKAGLFPSTPPAAARPPGAPSPAAPAPAPVAAATTITPDKIPLWGDLQGTAQIQLKTLRFHAFTVDNFQIAAQVSPTQAILSGVTGTFQGAPLSLNATLGFDPKQADLPYQLATGVSFKSFDVGAYFKSRDANTTPPVEGNFSITGNASGRGANIDDVIDKVQFNFALSSDGGTFHLLDLVPNKSLSGVLKTIAKVSGLAGPLLGLLGQKDPTSGKAAMATSIINLLASLDAFQYTKFAFEAQRGADLTIKLSQFDVQSAQVELAGVGQVKYVHGQAIPDQPLTATLSLNAKGGVAQGLQALNMIHGTAASGYSQGPQFQVGGSMQHPDYQFLNNLLTQGAAALGLK